VANLYNRMSRDPRRDTVLDLTLDSWENVEIALFNMKTGDPSGYNWKTNESSNPPVLLFSGPAQMQMYRFTLTMDSPAGSVSQIRNARFTLDRKLVESINIRKGHEIRIIDSPHDHSLETYQFVVNSGINSGSAFRRTIETEVDMSRIVSPIITDDLFSGGTFGDGEFGD